MSTWFLEDGAPISLGDRVGGGGEGGVYRVVGQSFAAKIYHSKANEREAKVRAMIARPPAGVGGPNPMIAWPLHTVHDRDGNFAGFTMPLVAGKVLLKEALSRDARAAAFRSQHPEFVYQCAANLAAVVEAIHASGYVIGDINAQNFLVDEQALITLIDADSLQVRAPTGLFTCRVGTPEFTPPELQGKALPDIERTMQHDAFGLAVLLFQLVFNDVHPFRAKPDASDAETGKDNDSIRAGRFAYSGRVRGFGPPPYARRWETVEPELRDAFERTFLRGHGAPSSRVSAGEWKKLFARAQKRAAGCQRDSSHPAYWSRLRDCPVCDPSTTPRPLFPALGRSQPVAAAAQVPLGTTRPTRRARTPDPIGNRAARWVGAAVQRSADSVGDGAHAVAALSVLLAAGAFWYGDAPTLLRVAVAGVCSFAWLWTREAGLLTSAAAKLATIVSLVSVGFGLFAGASFTEPPPAPHPVAAPIAAVPRPAPPPEVPTACGRGSTPRRAGSHDWSTYSCRARPEVGIGWESCMSWRSYAPSRDEGCPGAERCCPAGPLAGAIALPADLCVNDRTPPMRVRSAPEPRSDSVADLTNGTAVRVERTEGEWALISAPVAGWAWIPWLGDCGSQVPAVTAERASPSEPEPESDLELADDDSIARADVPDQAVGRIRAHLDQRDVAGAITAFRAATGRSVAGLDDLRSEIARVGENAVRARLQLGDCDGAQQLFRSLRSIGAAGPTTIGLFSAWCPMPAA